MKFAKSKKILVVIIIVLFPIVLFTAHEISVRHFQDKTCVLCHEMREPIKKWRESGTAKNHNNCAGCHWDKGFAGWMEMNKSAVKFFFTHFKRNSNEPIALPQEPLFLEEGKEPGYWSLVPNSRCFQCKNAKNHQQIDQPKIHNNLIKSIANQPCKDCHNHEMRKGQKFYEKVLPQQEASASSSAYGG